MKLEIELSEAEAELLEEMLMPEWMESEEMNRFRAKLDCALQDAEEAHRRQIHQLGAEIAVAQAKQDRLEKG